MLIFLYGADVYRSTEKLRALKNTYFEKNRSGTDLSVLDYGNSSANHDLESMLGAQGLFSNKQLVIVQEALSSASLEKQKELVTFLKTKDHLLTDADTILIFFEAGTPKKSLALFKFLATKAKKQEFAPLEGAKLSQWALSFASKLAPEINFSKAALDLLLASTGNDLFMLSNEINKLVNFKNAGEISVEDVRLLVKSRVDSTMFETIEALASGNKAQALRLFHEQIAKGEDVFYILSMYTYQIRTLLKIGDFFWQGLTSAPQIAQASGLHPYVVQKSLAQIRNLSEAKTKQMLRELAEIDFNAKTGKIDPILALDTFIVSI